MTTFRKILLPPSPTGSFVAPTYYNRLHSVMSHKTKVAPNVVNYKCASIGTVLTTFEDTPKKKIGQKFCALIDS